MGSLGQRLWKDALKTLGRPPVLKRGRRRDLKDDCYLLVQQLQCFTVMNMAFIKKEPLPKGWHILNAFAPASACWLHHMTHRAWADSTCVGKCHVLILQLKWCNTMSTSDLSFRENLWLVKTVDVFSSEGCWTQLWSNHPFLTDNLQLKKISAALPYFTFYCTVLK